MCLFTIINLPLMQMQMPLSHFRCLEYRADSRPKGVSARLPQKKWNLLEQTRKLNLILGSSDNFFGVNLVMRGTLVIGLCALVVHSSVIEAEDPLEIAHSHDSPSREGRRGPPTTSTSNCYGVNHKHVMAGSSGTAHNLSCPILCD